MEVNAGDAFPEFGPAAMFGRVAPNPDEQALMRTAVRLLSDGGPVAPDAITGAAGRLGTDVEDLVIGPDIEYDPAGLICGWGLSLAPTAHGFEYQGRKLYTWCGPDTLVFSRLLGGPVRITSECPVTGGGIRIKIDAGGSLVDLQPATAMVGYVRASQIQRGAVRSACCRPQRFVADGPAARRWADKNPGLSMVPVREAYEQSAGVLDAAGVA